MTHQSRQDRKAKQRRCSSFTLKAIAASIPGTRFFFWSIRLRTDRKIDGWLKKIDSDIMWFSILRILTVSNFLDEFLFKSVPNGSKMVLKRWSMESRWQVPTLRNPKAPNGPATQGWISDMIFRGHHLQQVNTPHEKWRFWLGDV